MPDIKNVLENIIEMLLRDCTRYVEQNCEREVRAVLRSTVGLVIVFDFSEDSVESLFKFVCEHPVFVDELTPLEVLLSESQRIRLGALKLLLIETRSVIMGASRPLHPALFH